MSTGVERFAPAVLRDARHGAGLSREGLAILLGVSGATVSMWESGRTSPTPANLMKLAIELNLTVDDLLRTPRAEATVANLRERAGLSGAELAAELGVGPSKYSRVERGLDAPTRDQLDAMVRVMGVTGAELTDAWQRSRAAQTRRRPKH